MQEVDNNVDLVDNVKRYTGLNFAGALWQEEKQRRTEQTMQPIFHEEKSRDDVDLDTPPAQKGKRRTVTLVIKINAFFLQEMTIQWTRLILWLKWRVNIHFSKCSEVTFVGQS